MQRPAARPQQRLGSAEVGTRPTVTPPAPCVWQKTCQACSQTKSSSLRPCRRATGGGDSLLAQELCEACCVPFAFQIASAELSGRAVYSLGFPNAMLGFDNFARHNESILSLVGKVCTKMSLADIASECEQVREVLKDTNTMFSTLHDASTADLSQVLADVKKYASEVVTQDCAGCFGRHIGLICGHFMPPSPMSIVLRRPSDVRSPERCSRP